ncbi:hypothetical protein Q5P01_014995 [Channa striata]|uniref:Uncharacterized protein n=1 Tax=Channa striata TaxID=64152 RepID=A0AA88MJC7_CHASR|nr:hypothetical protein Q5P01_014995 [Channa striata]
MKLRKPGLLDGHVGSTLLYSGADISVNKPITSNAIRGRAAHCQEGCNASRRERTQVRVQQQQRLQQHFIHSITENTLCYTQLIEDGDR